MLAIKDIIVGKKYLIILIMFWIFVMERRLKVLEMM